VADFTPDQLKVIGSIVVTFGGAIITIIWQVAQWKARVDYDLNNFGDILGTEKSKARKILLL